MQPLLVRDDWGSTFYQTFKTGVYFVIFNERNMILDGN